MSVLATAPPNPLANWPLSSFRRFTVAEYHRMIWAGILTEYDDLELLEGYLILKMSRNAPQDGTVQKANRRLLRRLPPGWDLRVQSAITLDDSEPEPDLAIVRGDEESYLTRHPVAGEVGVVIEVSDSTLAIDRNEKSRIYARAGIATYWILNLVDGRVEVFSGVGAGGYLSRQDYSASDAVPLVLDGQLVATVPASDLLP
jgi:Uma2 family endonuclease